MEAKHFMNHYIENEKREVEVKLIQTQQILEKKQKELHEEQKRYQELINYKME